MRNDIGSYLAPHYPAFAIQAVFSSLTSNEKTTLGYKLYQHLRSRAEPLRRHPEISAHRLGQSLPPEILDELHAEAQTGTDSILVANAFSLLGEAGRRDSLALARAKAFDKAHHVPDFPLLALEVPQHARQNRAPAPTDPIASACSFTAAAWRIRSWPPGPGPGG
jgi:hypothetical protein